MNDGRISALLDVPGYHAANQAFLKYWSSDNDELLDFIRNHAPTSIGSGIIGADENYEQTTTATTTATTSGVYEVLSVGAGDGRRDAASLDVLDEILPNTIRTIKYTAIEPSEEQMKALRERFESRTAAAAAAAAAAVAAAAARVDTGKRSRSIVMTPTTETTMTAEEFDFSSRGNYYDLILFTHSLYHMPGSEKAVLSKAINALRPTSGRIIAALSTEQGGIFQLMGTFWQKIDYSRFEVDNNNNNNNGGLFGQESLMKLLKDNNEFGGDGKNNCRLVELLQLPDVYIDVSICLNDDDAGGGDSDLDDDSNEEGIHLLNFVLQSDTTKLPTEVKEQVLEELKAKAPRSANNGRHHLPHGSGIFLISST